MTVKSFLVCSKGSPFLARDCRGGWLALRRGAVSAASGFDVERWRVTRWVSVTTLPRHRAAERGFEALRHLGEALVGGRARQSARLRRRPARSGGGAGAAARGRRRGSDGRAELVGEAGERVGRAHRANLGSGARRRSAVPPAHPRFRRRRRAGARGGGAGCATGAGTGSGCNGHGVGSDSGMARRGLGVAVARGRASRVAAAVPRTMLVSTTTSLGPPIISRCSTLSRRMMTSLRRPSTAAESITASRGWRPRAAASIRVAPKRRTSQAAAPISSSTKTNAMMKFTGVGSSTPKSCSSMFPDARTTGRSTRHQLVNAAGNNCRPEY